MDWTAEQLAIFSAAKLTDDNLLIEALAGASKTTTLVELASHLRGNTLCIAFNKRIADEMSERMPKGVHSKTLNALGHQIWSQHLGKKLRVTTSKTYNLLQDFAKDLGKADKAHFFKEYRTIIDVIGQAKASGHVPSACLSTKVKPLMTDEDFFSDLDEVLSPVILEAVKKVLTESFRLAQQGTIDFADQLLLPTVTRCLFPVYANVLVDEAQDLSELNHIMLAKLAKRRIIAVGDSHQAIYAFRGAHSSGMPLLASRFSMRTLTLSTTFRCPKAICDHVRPHVPNITSWAENPQNPGSVTTLSSWNFTNIPDGSAIICRNNAPLFNIALAMLKAGRKPQLWGRDLSTQLVKTMENLGPGNTPRAEALDLLATYYETKFSRLRKAGAKASLLDQVTCIQLFLSNAETLAGAISLAEQVLNAEGKVDLCTGHKAKGHEWNNVFILDRDLIGERGQEQNLAYVMATRSLSTLTYITTEGLNQ